MSKDTNIDDDKSSGKWTAPDSLIVRYIEQQHQELLELAEKTSTLNVDLCQLTTIDTSGYQLLRSLGLYCESQNKKLSFENINDALIESLVLLGDETIINWQHSDN